MVALNSLRYYWTPRTPEGAAADLARVMGHYLDAWHKSRAVLVGYSFGADVLPFLVNRLPPELKSRVALVALLSPGRKADFAFHLADWLGESSPRARPVLPEVQAIRGAPVLCVYGEREGGSLCPLLAPSEARVLERKGGHRIGGGYDAVVQDILQALR